MTDDFVSSGLCDTYGTGGVDVIGSFTVDTAGPWQFSICWYDLPGWPTPGYAAFDSNFMIMDGVARTLGLPAITIGGDTVDGRFYNDAQVDTRVQALLETIDAKRKSGRYRTSEAQ